jgi:hypothetical protein
VVVCRQFKEVLAFDSERVGASFVLEFFGSFSFKEKNEHNIVVTENRVFEKELTIVLE